MERHAVAYGFSTTVGLPHGEALRLARAALAAEGFGVLCEIDVAATLHAKIGADIGPYVILGACNPSLANAALTIDRDVGLLLPCNVVVYGTKDPGRTVVAVIDAERMMTLTEANGLLPIAADASARLLRALRAVEQSAPPAAPRSAAAAPAPLRPDGEAVTEEIC